MYLQEEIYQKLDMNRTNAIKKLPLKSYDKLPLHDFKCKVYKKQIIE